MRLRLALAALLVVLSATTLPGHAAPPAGTLTLRGSTSAWTTFDVPAGVTLDVSGATVTTSGRFGGFYLDSTHADGRRVGVVRLRDYHVPGDTAHLQELSTEPGTLPQGRYRLYLIADTATVVKIPVTGMASRVLRPANRTAASAAVQVLRPDGIAVQGRQPVTAARRSVSLSSVLLDDVQVFVGTISACLTAPGGACNSGRIDGGRAGYYVNPYGAYPFVFTVVYPPGTKAGRVDAVQEAENVAGITYAAGASFTLALV